MRLLRVSFVAVLLAAALSCHGATAATPSSDLIYGGLGSWIDIFDGPARAHPERVVASLHAHGVTTLYLQTSNYSQRVDIVDPLVVGRFLDAAHAAGIQTVAWYLPSFAHPVVDARRARAALRFRSATGVGFDSVALDIEASIVTNVHLRNARLLALAHGLRRIAGPAYPLGAIVPSPVGMRTHPKYWPRFPFRDLTTDFDALLPMAYFTYHAKTPAAAYRYTHDVMTILRDETGDSDLPVHLIGGIANHIGAGSLAAFIRAAQECGVAGLSLYAYQETSNAEWTRIAAASLGGTPASSCA